jgi:hypothetical protein
VHEYAQKRKYLTRTFDSQVFKSGVINVRRLSGLYDAQSFFYDKLNPNLHGLGHSGWNLWTDRKNPTHCIRFSRDGEAAYQIFHLINRLIATCTAEKGVHLQYKLREADADWRPSSKFDVNDRKWLPATCRYKLLQSPVDGSEPFISTAPVTDKVWERLKKGVADCSVQTSREWTSSDRESWDRFFQDPVGQVVLSPWVPTNIPSGNSPESDEIADIAMIESECAEPLVCADERTAIEWARTRKRKKLDQTQNTITTGRFSLEEGDIVVVIPDEDSRKRDEAAGYMIPVSFGKVRSVHLEGWGDIPEPCCQLTWLRSDSLSSKFSIWLQNDGNPSVDTVPIEALQVAQDGEVLKICLTSRGTLKPASRKIIEEIISKGAEDSV